MVCSTMLTMVGMATSTWEPMHGKGELIQTFVVINHKCLVTQVLLQDYHNCLFINELWVTISTLPHIELSRSWKQLAYQSRGHIHTCEKRKAKVCNCHWSPYLATCALSTHYVLVQCNCNLLESGQGARSSQEDRLYAHCMQVMCGHTKSHQCR